MPVDVAEALGQSLAARDHARRHQPVRSAALETQRVGERDEFYGKNCLCSSRNIALCVQNKRIKLQGLRDNVKKSLSCQVRPATSGIPACRTQGEQVSTFQVRIHGQAGFASNCSEQIERWSTLRCVFRRGPHQG